MCRANALTYSRLMCFDPVFRVRVKMGSARAFFLPYVVSRVTTCFPQSMMSLV